MDKTTAHNPAPGHPTSGDAPPSYSAIGSSATSLPSYNVAVEAGASSSTPDKPSPEQMSLFTHIFQIQTNGYESTTLSFSRGSTTIPILTVSPNGQVADIVYESIRPSRSSGNCVLVRAGDDLDAPVCSTTYRVGPGRPPRVQLHSASGSDVEEEFKIESKAWYSRSQMIESKLGNFCWRYADKHERREVDADNLLVLERTRDGKVDKNGQGIAQFMRNAETRTKGSGRWTSGNGGRLFLDLRDWSDTKGEMEQTVIFIVATCLVMLKKEVDRGMEASAAAIA